MFNLLVCFRSSPCPSMFFLSMEGGSHPVLYVVIIKLETTVSLLVADQRTMSRK